MNKRKLMLNIFICFGILFSLASCRTAGLYTTNPKGRMAFAGSEVELTSSDSFHLRSWTDVHTNYMDGDGNRIFKENRYRGYGTYECLGDSLEFTFCNEDSITIMLDIERKAKTMNITFQAFSELGNVFYPYVDILDPAGNKVDGTTIKMKFQMKDTSYFDVPLDKKPAQIKIMDFGVNVEDPFINIVDLDNGRYTFKRKSYNGYFSKGTVKTIWFKKLFSGMRYQMGDKKRYMPKQWGWSWINKLYRDY